MLQGSCRWRIPQCSLILALVPSDTIFTRIGPTRSLPPTHACTCVSSTVCPVYTEEAWWELGWSLNKSVASGRRAYMPYFKIRNMPFPFKDADRLLFSQGLVWKEMTPPHPTPTCLNSKRLGLVWKEISSEKKIRILLALTNDCFPVSHRAFTRFNCFECLWTF